MDTFASAIKNQHSFNTMLESQLAQLVAVVPPLEKGNIQGQPEDFETANLIDIHTATQYHIEPTAVQWIDHSLPEKMGDPRRPIIPISIGCHSFPEAICDFGASVKIMPNVIYETILNDPLLHTNMRLQLADQSICYPKGVLEEVVVRVGQSYVPVDFVVMETGVDEKAPIILGRPFLCTSKAIIYVEYAKIVLSIKDKKERFTFKNRVLKAPAAPKQFYHQGKQEQQSMPKNKNNRNNRRWRRTKHAPIETTQLITALNTENDHMLPKPFPIKRGDPEIPIIECTIKNTTFPTPSATMDQDAM